MTYSTSSFITETRQRYLTTKDNLMWGIENNFIHVFLVPKGDMFFGVDTEYGPYVFGKLPASEFIINLFGFSGGISINAEEVGFLVRDIIKVDDWVNMQEYSLLDEGE